jgi:hypothetical protein
VPSKVSYSASHDWIRAILRPLRVPIVFVLSALTSFCAFKDSSALVGRTPASALGRRSAAVRLALWDADLMPRGERLPVRIQMSRNFGQSVDPDVLVLYDVPSFAQLLKLRDALGLYGYTAVMSNFFCGTRRGAAKWPIEIAVLSRYPINRAIEFDPPSSKESRCANPGPHTNGPVLASHAPMAVPPRGGALWPATGGGSHPLPGPGFLTARIDAIRTVVVAVRVPAASEYPHTDPLTLGAMRQAIAASAKVWIGRKRAQFENDAVLAMGDFAVNPGIESTAQEPIEASQSSGTDTVDGLFLGGASGARDLTRNLLAEGVAPGVFPHSDRIYLWSAGPPAFGSAQRADNSFGSRAFPLVVRSSGATCAVDPLLAWRRHGKEFANVAYQVFTASEAALDRQLRAPHAGRRPAADWVVALDLDNVVLDNSPFLYKMAVTCRQPRTADWRTWLRSGHSRLTPGAARFLRGLRARAANGHGRIVLFTAHPSALDDATIADLTRLNVMTGADDKIVEVVSAPTAKARDAAWHRLTAEGARLALVVAGRADEFPDDPALPVGATPQACPNAPPSRAGRAHSDGPQTARFGRCYFLIPVHVT